MNDSLTLILLQPQIILARPVEVDMLKILVQMN